MRIGNQDTRRRKKKKQRSEQYDAEKDFFRFVEQGLEKTMDAAFDEIFKGWKWKQK